MNISGITAETLYIGMIKAVLQKYWFAVVFITISHCPYNPIADLSPFLHVYVFFFKLHHTHEPNSTLLEPVLLHILSHSQAKKPALRNIDGPSVMRAEVEIDIKKMKGDKAAGSDGITTEIIKALKESGVDETI